MREFKYPMNLKCDLCGKPSGDHNAAVGACPIGRKSTFQQFSQNDRFVPRLPQLPKLTQKKLDSYSKALLVVMLSGDALTSAMVERLNHTKYELIALLAEKESK